MAGRVGPLGMDTEPHVEFAPSSKLPIGNPRGEFDTHNFSGRLD